MGRHSAPAPEGQSRTVPRAALAAGLALLVLVVVVGVVATLALRDGDDVASTTGAPTATGPTGSAPPSSSPAPSVSSSAGSSPSTSGPSPAATSSSTRPRPPARPPTLAFRIVGTTYLTVRVPRGRTLVSRTFHKGQHGRFDQRAIEVVVGNSAAARFVVNGRPRPHGRRGEVEKFVVRRG